MPTMQQYKRISERIFSMESIHRRQSSMCRIKKSFKRNTILRNIEKQLTKDGKIVKAQFQNEIDEMNDREARSYAQMIANYNEVIYGSNSRLQKDNINSMGMIIHRSPFSTASVVLLKLKTKQDESKREKISSVCLNGSCSNHSNLGKLIKDTTNSRYYSQYNNNMNSMGNELQRSFSYAAMIERYSNAMKIGKDYYGWIGNLMSKRNVSTNLEEIPISIEAKKPDKPELPIMDEKTKIKDEQDQWLSKVDDVIRNLKRITEKTDSLDESKLKKKEVTTQVNERAKWLDRVMDAHKKSIEERKSMEEKESVIMDEASHQDEALESNNTWKTVLTKNSSKQPPRFPFDKPPSSTPIVDYIKRGPVSSGSPTNTTGSTSKTPSQTPTSVITGTTKEPQIELRMTPSQNESVVSINVDEQAAKTVGSSAKEQLSVVILSKKNTAGKMEMSNASQQSTDFGSMQISISEDTIPVKQIEFSINGKPVSELKSIVARADKLDVFSSMDKVEIRIPSKDRANVLKDQSRTITAASKPVLNLQIAAKFNDPRVQQPRGADIKKDTPSPVSPANPSPPLPPPVKPPRPQNLFDSIDIKKGGTMKEEARKDESAIKGLENTLDMMDVNKSAGNTSTPPPTHQQIETLSVPGIHGSVPKEENVLTVRNIPLNLNPNEAIFQKGSVPQENCPSQLPPTMNKANLSNKAQQENKIPSSVIPWWSSEDSFKNIKKKDNNPGSGKTAVSLEGTLPLVQTDHEDHALRKENNMSSDVASRDKQHDTIDSKRVDNPGDDTRKPSSIVETEPIINYLEESGKRCAPIKLEGAKASPRNAKNSGRIVKRSKLRVKHKGYRRKAPLPVKKESEASSSMCSVCSPKILKYVQVVPREAKVEKKSETKTSLIEQSQKTGHEVDKLKLNEEKKTETKIVKSIILVGDDTHVEKANVQNSNTVFKKEKALGKSSANKSADVSAKSSSSAGKVDYDGKKEGRQGTEGTATPKDQADKLVSEDQRIKEILKSMKPIEKRKDGTLIDYGVTVPSRKPNATGAKTDLLSKQSVSSSEKIIEPTKIFSTKKQAPTLVESRNLGEQLKIVEAERTHPVKKITKLDDSKIEIKKPELKVEAEQATKQNKEKESLVKRDDNFEAQKSAITANLHSNLKQTGNNPVRDLFVEPHQKIRITGSAPLKGTLSDHGLENLKKNATSVEHPLLTKKSENVFPATSIASSSNPSENSEKKESKDILKLIDEKKMSIGLLNVTASSPKIENKTTDKVDIFPLMGTVNPVRETKSSTETVKSDSLMKEYVIPLKNSGNKTGAAPLEGTIQRSTDNFANVNEKKANEGKNDLPKMDVLKKPSDGGGGNTGSNPVPVGPSGLVQSSIYTPTTCKQKNWDYNKHDQEYMMYNEMKRPEKDMLYSSWLQRFKDRFNNKII